MNTAIEKPATMEGMTSDRALMLSKVEAAELDAATVDDMLGARDFIGCLKEAIKEAEARVDAAMERHIRANGPIRSGDDYWYVGFNKKTKCRDTKKAVDAILMVAAGDEQRLLDCFSANWVKHGTVKKLLKEFGQEAMYDELFETVKDDKLKNGEPTKEELQYINTRFLK